MLDHLCIHPVFPANQRRLDLEYDLNGNVRLASEPPTREERRLIEEYLAAGRVADAETVLDGRELCQQ